MIEELSISGGGVKGYAYLGALLELERMGMLSKLKKISGVSIGSLFAASLAIGMKMCDLVEYTFNYDISEIKDLDIKGLIKRKSLLKGEKYVEFITNIITQKVDKDITLLELYEYSGIDLIVAVICLNDRCLNYISHKTDPDMKLITLIQMSSAIPGFLPPVSYNGKLYLDGGILDNNPVHCLSPDALGICQKSKDKKESIEIVTFIDYFSTIIRMIYSSIQSNVKSKHFNWIEVESKDVSVTSFNITKDQKMNLLINGIESVRKKFNHS